MKDFIVVVAEKSYGVGVFNFDTYEEAKDHVRLVTEIRTDDALPLPDMTIAKVIFPSKQPEERVMNIVCVECQALGSAIIDLYEDTWELKQFTCPNNHNFPPSANIYIDVHWSVEQIRNNSEPVEDKQ